MFRNYTCLCDETVDMISIMIWSKRKFFRILVFTIVRKHIEIQVATNILQHLFAMPLLLIYQIPLIRNIFNSKQYKNRLTNHFIFIFLKISFDSIRHIHRAKIIMVDCNDKQLFKYFRLMVSTHFEASLIFLCNVNLEAVKQN